jgi:hypothetical protein
MTWDRLLLLGLLLLPLLQCPREMLHPRLENQGQEVDQ